MRDFRKYDVWNKGIAFGKTTDGLAARLPQSERYGLINQMQRAAVSISSNIAEGCSRSSEKDFARFIEIAMGSAFEVESQLYLCNELEYFTEHEIIPVFSELTIIQKQLNSLYQKLMFSSQQQKANSINKK